MALTTKSPQAQITQLKEQLQEERKNNKDKNKLIQTHLDYLSRDLDILFASKTWKIGYAVISLYRRVMNLLGKRQDGQYMNASHFKNMVDNCGFYTYFKTKLQPTIDDVIAGKFPNNHYEQTHVKTALRDIWLAQTEHKEKQQNDH